MFFTLIISLFLSLNATAATPSNSSPVLDKCERSYRAILADKKLNDFLESSGADGFEKFVQFKTGLLVVTNGGREILVVGDYDLSRHDHLKNNVERKVGTVGSVLWAGELRFENPAGQPMGWKITDANETSGTFFGFSETPTDGKASAMLEGFLDVNAPHLLYNFRAHAFDKKDKHLDPRLTVDLRHDIGGEVTNLLMYLDTGVESTFNEVHQYVENFGTAISYLREKKILIPSTQGMRALITYMKADNYSEFKAITMRDKEAFKRLLGSFQVLMDPTSDPANATDENIKLKGQQLILEF